MSIIIGYQGIGKSTLANSKTGFIDLESSHFRVNGVRPDDWYKAYCNIALYLSRQGYDVFMSSHAVVQKRLSETNSTGEKIIVCYPAKALREAWTKKLQERHEKTQLDKDFRAWKNAEDRYEANIQELIDDAEKYGFVKAEIASADYKLEEVLKPMLLSLGGGRDYGNG